jgi:hypothetical protein
MKRALKIPKTVIRLVDLFTKSRKGIPIFFSGSINSSYIVNLRETSLAFPEESPSYP